jgi:myo-inositol catabolism protein IolC
MFNQERVYMLAADHRWQWEQWCDARSIPRARVAAAASRTAAGFAIGRSFFWEPSAAFLSGSSTAARAAADICANYLQLVDAWQQSRV